jgi:hypothetical protein
VWYFWVSGFNISLKYEEIEKMILIGVLNYLPNNAEITCLSNVCVMRPVPLIDDLANVDLSKKTSIKLRSKRVAEPLSSLHAFKSLADINTSKPGDKRIFSFD